MKYVVYVHGASRHLPGYSLPWFESLKPFLGDAEVERVEVLYSDIVNPTMHWVPEWAFRRMIEAERRRKGYGDWVIPWAPGILAEVGRQFVSWPNKREEVIQRVVQSLDGPLSQTSDVTVICHSFGTIVMPEVCWHWEKAGLGIPVIKNLIMWGGRNDLGPLVNLWEKGKENWKVHRPMLVDRIYNLSCYGDFAGGPSDPTLWVPRPGDVDLGTRIKLYGKRDIPGGHCDGFNPDNVDAQRIVAEAVLR